MCREYNRPRPRNRNRIDTLFGPQIDYDYADEDDNTNIRGNRMQFDHERLHVYQVELNFIRWLTPLLAEMKKVVGPETAEVRNHLDRAALSSLLNIAEGNGKRASRLRDRFFDDARGSATECAACLDALVAKGAIDVGRIEEGKNLLLRIVQMLTKIIKHTDDTGHVSDGHNEYRVDYDYADEDADD